MVPCGTKGLVVHVQLFFDILVHRLTSPTINGKIKHKDIVCNVNSGVRCTVREEERIQLKPSVIRDQMESPSTNKSA